MDIKEFQDALFSLAARDFEHFVAEALRTSGRFENVSLAMIGPDKGVDIVAEEVTGDSLKRRTWYFQVKKTRVAGGDLARYMATIEELHRLSRPSAELALVLAGNMTAEARAMLESRHIHVWDALTLAALAPADLLKRYFGECVNVDKAVEEDRSDAFSLALDQLSSGRANWTEYKRLAADILEIFFLHRWNRQGMN